MTRPDGCHEHASDQTINQALKKLSQRCEFVANEKGEFRSLRGSFEVDLDELAKG